MVPVLAERESGHHDGAHVFRLKRSRTFTGPASCGSATAAIRRASGEFRGILPHHRNSGRGLRRQRLGLRGAGRTPMDHRLHAGTGAGRRLGRGPAGGRRILAGAQGNRANDGGRLAAERAVSVFVRLSAFAMGDHRRALRGRGRQSPDPLLTRSNAARSRSSMTGRCWACAAPAAGHCCSMTFSSRRIAAFCCGIFMTAPRRAPRSIRIIHCCARRAACVVPFSLDARRVHVWPAGARPRRRIVKHPPVARHPRHWQSPKSCNSNSARPRPRSKPPC